MAVTSSYKEYQRLERIMTVEDVFNLGMSYTNTPLREGYVKLLVNYDLKNRGDSLVPRGGIKLTAERMADVVLPSTHTYAVHHVGSTLVMSEDGQDATVHKYVLVAPIMEHAVSGRLCYAFNQAYVFVDTPDGYKSAIINTDHYSNIKYKLNTMHDMSVNALPECNTGIFVSIGANTYIPVFNVANVDRQFVQLKLEYTEEGDIAASLPTLEPKEVPASQTINSGYNMMKDDPYDFPNVENATGALNLLGIVPKDATGQLKLTNYVGEQVRYHLNYSYPVGDLDKQYRVQWEVKDTTTGSAVTVLRQVRRSPVYTPSSDIFIDYTVGYKQYTIIVKVYYNEDVDAHPYVSEEDDAKNLVPAQVITVSSYTTTSASKKNSNLTARKYDLTTCSDMCVWQQRTVMWGVEDATTTLFVSQPNMPEYVAYPNDVEVFNEDIVTCVPYLDALLVFTTSKLYKLEFVTDGAEVYYTTKCIQEHLPMTKEDASTIHTVKNMVYFKSNNYFYMIVPNMQAGLGELQLAPVSTPIEGLLDNFSTALNDIINEVYNIPEKFDFKENQDDSYTLTLVDYTNHLEGSTLRNVYKVKLDVYKLGLLAHTLYLDFILNYDTVVRAWTTYLVESNRYRLTPYEHTVTQGMLFIMPVHNSALDRSTTLNQVKYTPTSPSDEAPVYATASDRVFANYQLLDTGQRSHYASYKKRFREIQLTINNTNQATLQFYTAFVLDDDVRKDLFKYEVQQIIDPDDPDFGLVYVERSLSDPLSLEHSDSMYVAQVPTALLDKLRADNAVNFDTIDPWLLDFSKFPTLTVAKIRYKISGKGYLGKMKLLSINDTMYELLGTNWVYRKMNAR